MNPNLLITNPELLSTPSLVVHGNTFIYGWLISWTTWLFGGIILGLIIWNIILTLKVRNSKHRGKQ